MQNTKKTGIWILTIVISIVATMFLHNYYKEKKITDEGVFQIAIVFKKDKAKNGTWYHFKYSFKGMSYNDGLLSSGVDTLFTIKFCHGADSKGKVLI